MLVVDPRWWCVGQSMTVSSEWSSYQYKYAFNVLHSNPCIVHCDIKKVGFFCKHWIAWKPTYTVKHDKNVFKYHDCFILYQGDTTLAPENSTGMHLRGQAWVSGTVLWLFLIHNFKQRDKVWEGNICFWECHHDGSPPQDVCVLHKTFIGPFIYW